MNQQTSVIAPSNRDKKMEEQSPVRWHGWIAPVWFLLGVLAGVASLTIFNALAVQSAPGLAAVAMREAARDGTLDAIATLQAGGPQPASGGPSTPAADKASFTLRDANRVGTKAAQVTIVEFSDFQ